MFLLLTWNIYLHAVYLIIFLSSVYPGRHLPVSNRNTRTRCEICSKLTIKTPERRSGVFIINFEHISYIALVFLLLTLNM